MPSAARSSTWVHGGLLPYLIRRAGVSRRPPGPLPVRRGLLSHALSARTRLKLVDDTPLRSMAMTQKERALRRSAARHDRLASSRVLRLGGVMAPSDFLSGTGAIKAVKGTAHHQIAFPY